jgi:hypothetical protein
LGGRRVSNSPSLWVRGKSCLEPIVTPAVFERVQRILGDRRIEIEEDEMLLRLRRLLHKKGRLSPAIIDNAKGLPGVHCYIRHFGSLRDVYRLIGYTSERDYTFIDAIETWELVTQKLIGQVAAHLEKSCRHVAIGNDDVRIDGKIGVQFRVARAYPIEGCLTQWRIPEVRKTSHRWMVAIRLTNDNKSVHDYLTLPKKALAYRIPTGYARLTDRAQERLGFSRHRTAEALASWIASMPLAK